jgi:hypothetical protein
MSRLFTAFLLAATLSGADLSGIWVGQIPGRNGDMLDIAFKFKQDGANLAGKVYGDYGSSPIVKGSVDGDQILFVVLSPEQNGNQINSTRLRFTGHVITGQTSGAEIELTRERESATNAGNGGAVEARKGGLKSQMFRLKRLL